METLEKTKKILNLHSDVKALSKNDVVSLDVKSKVAAK